jgi:hypothetical protein
MEWTARNSLPPEWLDAYEQFQLEFKSLNRSFEELKHVQSERLKITFGDSKIAEKDKTVAMLSMRVT